MRIFHVVQKRAPFIYLTFCLYGSGSIVEPVKLLIMMILLFFFASRPMSEKKILGRASQIADIYTIDKLKPTNCCAPIFEGGR